MLRSPTATSLRLPLASKLLEAMKPQQMTCRSCGNQWIGTSSACPRCDGVAKSEGEMTKKVIDDPDLKKGLR